jgi:hypothetical protein
MFIDAVILYGQSKNFSVSVNVLDEEAGEFVPFDLSDYAVSFKILGSPTANAEVLVEHIITEISDLDEDGQITDAQNGQFTFNITAEDTATIGLGQHPIKIDIVDSESLDLEFTLTEGGKDGEFNKVYIVQV